MNIHLSRCQKNIMIPFRKPVLCLFILFTVNYNSFCQDLLNYKNSLKYANYLFENKQYKFSAIEFERVTYLSPNDTLAKLRLIQSYRLNNDLLSAKNKLDIFFPNNETMIEDFAAEKFKILFHENQFLNAYNFIKINKTIPQPKKTEYELGTLLMQYNWNQAKSLAEKYFHSNQATITINDLYNISLKGINNNYKNPGIAALFSSVVPGSGKLYTKRYKDAFYSFLFVSAFSFLTYKSIKNNGLDSKSVVFGTIAAGFYAANVYGSHKSACEYNRRLNQHTTNNIEKIIFDE